MRLTSPISRRGLGNEETEQVATRAGRVRGECRASDAPLLRRPPHPGAWRAAAGSGRRGRRRHSRTARPASRPPVLVFPRRTVTSTPCCRPRHRCRPSALTLAPGTRCRGRDVVAGGKVARVAPGPGRGRRRSRRRGAPRKHAAATAVEALPGAQPWSWSWNSARLAARAAGARARPRGHHARTPRGRPHVHASRQNLLRDSGRHQRLDLLLLRRQPRLRRMLEDVIKRQQPTQ